MTWCRQATSHHLDQCLAKFVYHYQGANVLIYSQTVAELTDFYLVVCMASNLICWKQRFGSTSIIHLSIRRDSVGPLSHQRWSGVFVARVIALHWPRLGAPVSPLCFADHAAKQSVMHAPGFAAASATPGSQWHKTMLGQSHHGINSYKGRHKQRNRSKRFPIYWLRRPTRLHRNPAETSHTWIHRAGIRRLELGWYLSDSPGVEPTPGSTDRTQGVCGVVGLDCADGLEREIERHPATHTYFEYTSIKAYKPCAQKNYHVSSDTAFRARLDCTETGDVIHKNSPGGNSTGRTRRILFRLSRMDPLPGSIDCRQGVCGVVRFDSADGLELVIQRYAPTQPYFEDTFIKSWESCEQKNYR